jgi:hypothetical protein
MSSADGTTLKEMVASKEGAYICMCGVLRQAQCLVPAPMPGLRKCDVGKKHRAIMRVSV